MKGAVEPLAAAQEIPWLTVVVKNEMKDSK